MTRTTLPEGLFRQEVVDALRLDEQALALEFAHLYQLVTVRPLMDPVVLELCRLRVAMLLGCTAEYARRHEAARDAGLDDAVVAELPRWTSSTRLGPREHAALAYTEQFLLDSKHLEREIEHLRAVFTEEEIFTLSVAVGLFEGFQRWRLVVDDLLPPPNELAGREPGDH
jgi:alkylhydroperoxidase family enzyme